jgi:hypothetical protein
MGLERSRRNDARTRRGYSDTFHRAGVSYILTRCQLKLTDDQNSPNLDRTILQDRITSRMAHRSEIWDRSHRMF